MKHAELREIPAPRVHSFKNAEGRVVTIRELSRTHIGRGNYANIYRLTAMVSDGNGKERPAVFVLKEFHPYDVPRPEEEKKKALQKIVQRAFTNHQPLKQANITTWTTYRLDAVDGTSILMTDGELLDTDYLISDSETNQSISKEFLRGKVTSIPNFEEAVAHALQNLQRAAKAKIRITSDTWLYRLRLDGTSAELHMLAGDSDSVVQGTAEAGTLTLDPTYQNLLSLWSSLSAVLRTILTPDKVQLYLQRTHAILVTAHPKFAEEA